MHYQIRAEGSPMSGAKTDSSPTPQTKGEKTRGRILDATLELIAEHGLRNVTHRAVAKQADVQLSLTTYYFKDIQELIQQAFTRFCENARPNYEDFWGEIEAYLDQFSNSDLRRLATREQVCARLTATATDYIESQIVDKPVGLAVEQVFFTQLRLSPELRELAAKHRKMLLAPLIRLCARFNRDDPEIDAELLLDTITRLEYQALWTNDSALQRELTSSLIRRQLGWVLGLKRA
jgi:DNA-binding transcriptional regulator YbjK